MFGFQALCAHKLFSIIERMKKRTDRNRLSAAEEDTTQMEKEYRSKIHLRIHPQHIAPTKAATSICWAFNIKTKCEGSRKAVCTTCCCQTMSEVKSAYHWSDLLKQLKYGGTLWVSTVTLFFYWNMSPVPFSRSLSVQIKQKIRVQTTMKIKWFRLSGKLKIICYLILCFLEKTDDWARKKCLLGFSERAEQ